MSQKTISDVNIDNDHLTRIQEEEERVDQLLRERLPGIIKTKWALKYKLNLDQAIEDALSYEETIVEKQRTKGRFLIEARTNAGNWMRDRDWIHLANPGLKHAEQVREDFDMKLLVKR